MKKSKKIIQEVPYAGTRLNKFISESGLCSRREADRYIELGQVLVNGKRAEIGTLVSSKDKVLVNGLLIEPKPEEDFVLLAFNKPRGIVSTTDKSERDNIIDYVNYHERIFPIGRLDKDSQGLIFLTNDGDIVNKILRAGNKHEKEYIVTVNKSVTDDFVKKMSGGVPILGEITKKCRVEKISEYVFKIILVQGLNRQIRRMCEYLGYEVEKLERIRIMNISLKGIGIGDWRFLNEKEMKELKAAISDSSGEIQTEKKKLSKSESRSSRSTFKESFVFSNKSKSTSKQITNFNPKAKELRGKGKMEQKRKRRY
ncbi:MAG: 23S rRNA pseudouridine(2604) synthase RluF [Bacteroidia bacterium]|nr:23S rRNA pseudouridine(2604) synthase RluF [Bacteroidia bacterium]